MDAVVTVLQDVVADAADSGETGPAPRAAKSFEARVLFLEQPLMDLATRQPTAVGEAIRIDTGDAIWLGEVEECSAAGDGYSMRVRLRHVLRDFETLARLAERFGTPAAKGLSVQI
jgi:serine protease inhibitor ecotin